VHTYIQAIAVGFPEIQCFAHGDGTVYASIQSADPGIPLPSQAELDTWIRLETQQEVWAEIQVIRAARSAGGIRVGANWFHSDATSRIQQLALVMFGQSMPQGIMWKTMGGTFVGMTPALAGQIFQAAAASDMAIFAIAEQKRAAMLLMADPGEYDVNSGWPLSYGE